ncbi:MAG: GNAT family N-acetyltransferase [Nevskia sp.]|nr:GNAT family N-acetyltransferase [Nevskia sp.]
MCATPRLLLRHLQADDAAFILRLLNEPSFIRNIGDRGVRSLEDARRYIEEGPAASYRRFGFGLYLVQTRQPQESIGICGLLKRDSLADVDIGFAFLPAWWSQGYALESATAVLRHARQSLGLQRIVAVTAPHNRDSMRLLEKLGLERDCMVELAPGQPPSLLFVPRRPP